MLSWKLPFDLGDILLTPQGAGLNPLLQTALLAAVCLVPLALVLWLYRYEMQLVARSTAIGLLCLRGTVLTLLLILVCLQPIYGRTRSEGLSGYVLVAVDRSESMDVADRQRPHVEKLRLARALKLANGICSDAQLDDWIKDYEQKGSPQWIKSNEPDDDLARRREITKERRAAHDKLCAVVDALTRTQAAERILSGDGVRLLPALTAKHDVELLGFHREAWEVKPEQLEELFLPFPDTQAAAFTDLRLPLTRALERSGPGQGKVLGIVVLTDGQHNIGEPPTVKARELGERHLPIYPIALGARQPPPDAAMVAVQAPNTVFKDVDTPIEATFKITGLPAQDFLVELRRIGKDGKKVLAERIVHHAGKDRTYSESFPVRMDEVGTQTLQAAIRPVNPDTKETRRDNNDRATTVSVADDKANVLLIDGEARWEYHYLATALKRDRTMKVESVVFHQPRLNEEGARGEGRGARQNISSLSLPRQQLPSGGDALAGFDCIILGDVGAEQLPLAERLRLEKYVAERGGTLVILAGKRFMPLAYPDIEANGEADPLRKLLPIERPRVVAPDDGFPVTLTQIGKETKFLEMDADPAKSAAIWRELPPHFWGVVGRAKPGATMLAYVPDAMEPREPGEAEKQSALIVRQNYGFGRVLFVGLDSTWRWRYRVGDVYHHTFWGSAIRWAASDKPLMTGNDYLRFGTSQPIYSRGEEVKLVVRLNEELGPLKPDLLAAARILKPGKTGESEKAVALVPLSRREAQPRVLEGRLRDLPPGEYAIELVMPDYADKLTTKAGPPDKPMRARFTIRPPDSKEMIDLETRWPLLEEIAAKSGGKVFTPDNAGELVDLLVKQSVPYTERREQKLWQWWVLLVLVLAFLTVEWAGRKLAGLP